MSDDDPDLTDFETIITEFENDIRLEKSPTIVEFQRKYPEFAEEIDRFLPTVLALENAKLSKKRNQNSQWKTPTIEKLGEFRIVREIGRGGMGIVFEAEQEALARRVAIKVLPKHLLLSENALKRFHREAKTAAQLHHTNIVSIVGVGEEDGLHYYVMQYIDGVGLNEVMKLIQPPEPLSGEDSETSEIMARVRTALLNDEFSSHNSTTSDSLSESNKEIVGIDYFKSVARIGLQVADALDYAHRHQVLHRDIKPANLMIQSDGKVWVMDFGVAKAFEDMAVSMTGDIVGTPRYMAPEQFKGKATAQSDIYSLGVTLFELLTLQAADERMRDSGTLSTVPHLRPLMRLRRFNSRIPRDLETIIIRATSLEPRQRYKNAAALAVDLQRFIFDQPIVARRASAFEKTVRWCKRNPALATLSSLAVSLLLIILAISVSSYFRERAQRQKIESALALSIDSLEKVYEQNAPNTIRELSIPLDIETESGAYNQSGISRESAKMLEDLLPYYDQVAELDNDNLRLKFQAAQAIRRVGEIHAQLGNWSKAKTALGRAIRRFESEQLADYDTKKIRIEIARTWMALGDLNYRQYLIKEGDTSYQTALKTLSRVQNDTDRELVRDPEIRFMIATVNFNLGTVPNLDPREQLSVEPLDVRQFRMNLEREGRKSYRDEALKIIANLDSKFPSSAKCNHLHALCLREHSERIDDEDMASALDKLHKLVERFPEVNEFRLNLCETYARVNPPLLTLDEIPKAIRMLDQAIKYSRGVNQNTIRYKLMIVHAHHKIGTLYVRLIRENLDVKELGSLEDYKRIGVFHLESAIELHEDIFWEEDQDWSIVWMTRFRASLISALGERDGPGDREHAIEMAKASIEDCKRLLKANPDSKFGLEEQKRWQHRLEILESGTDWPR